MRASEGSAEIKPSSSCSCRRLIVYLCALSCLRSSRFVRTAFRRVPSGIVRKFFEMRVSDHGFIEVLRIRYDGCDRQPGGVGVRIGKRLEVFFQQRVPTVGNPVLLQICRVEVGGYYLQIIGLFPLFSSDDE